MPVDVSACTFLCKRTYHGKARVLREHHFSARSFSHSSYPPPSTAHSTYTDRTETAFSAFVVLNNVKPFPAFKGAAVRKHGQKKKPLPCPTALPPAEKEPPSDTLHESSEQRVDGELMPVDEVFGGNRNEGHPRSAMGHASVERPSSLKPATASRALVSTEDAVASGGDVRVEGSSTPPIRRKKQIRFAEYDEVVGGDATLPERTAHEGASAPPMVQTVAEQCSDGQHTTPPCQPSRPPSDPGNRTHSPLPACDPPKLSCYIPLRQRKPVPQPQKTAALPSLPQVPSHAQHPMASSPTHSHEHRQHPLEKASRSKEGSASPGDSKDATDTLVCKSHEEQERGIEGACGSQAYTVSASSSLPVTSSSQQSESDNKQREPQLQQPQLQQPQQPQQHQQQNTQPSSSGEEKSGCILREIKETEKCYLSDLLSIERNYARPSCVVLSPQERAVLYGNLSELIALTTKFNAELQQVPPERPFDVGACFVKFKDDLLAVYKLYCANHEHSNLLLKELEKRERVRDFLQSKKNADPKKLDLKDYLIKPVQRVCRYPLLLKELQKSGSTSTELATAIQAASDVLDATNAEIENEERFLYLYRLCGYAGISPHLLLSNFDRKIIDSRILMVRVGLEDKRPPSSMYTVLTKSHLLFG